MKKYLVIERAEDAPSVNFYTEEGLTKCLNEGVFDGYTFLKDVSSDLEYFPDMSILIFCNGVVIPEPVKKVTTYKL